MLDKSDLPKYIQMVDAPIWIDIIGNLQLPVLEGDDQNPPVGYADVSLAYRRASLKYPALPGQRIPRYLHYCAFCKGWIPGQALEFIEDSTDISLRRDASIWRVGTVIACARCGREIAFIGKSVNF